MHSNNKYKYDPIIPQGGKTSNKIFEMLSSGIEWITRNNTCFWEAYHIVARFHMFDQSLNTRKSFFYRQVGTHHYPQSSNLKALSYSGTSQRHCFQSPQSYNKYQWVVYPCLEIQVNCFCVGTFHEFGARMKYRYTKTTNLISRQGYIMNCFLFLCRTTSVLIILKIECSNT